MPKPTRSGYTFKGWYTSRTGGKEVSSTTKMGSKNVKIYAQWTKGSSTTNPTRVLNSEEKKLVGEWWTTSGPMVWHFIADGSFFYIIDLTYSFRKYAGADGFYSIKNGVLTTTARYGEDTYWDRDGKLDLSGWKFSGAWRTDTNNIKFGTDEKGQYVELSSWHPKFYKK